MSIVKEVYNQTVKLYSILLQGDSAQENRDDFIEVVQKHIDDRQVLITQLKPPFSDDEKALGQEIAKYDSKIQSLLKKVQNDIKNDLTSLKQKKKQQNKYENPYLPYGDGTFLDERK